MTDALVIYQKICFKHKKNGLYVMLYSHWEKVCLLVIQSPVFHQARLSFTHESLVKYVSKWISKVSFNDFSYFKITGQKRKMKSHCNCIWKVMLYNKTVHKLWEIWLIIKTTVYWDTIELLYARHFTYILILHNNAMMWSLVYFTY